MLAKCMACIIIVCCFIQLLPAREVEIFDLKGVCVGRIEIPEHAGLPLIVNSLDATRLPQGFPSELPQGIYIAIEANNDCVQINGFRDPELVFMDITDSHLPPGLYSCYSVTVADFNGDQRDDIFFTIGLGSAQEQLQPRIWMQQPEGQFLDETAVRLPVFLQPGEQALALDHDQDGDLDILIVSNNEPVLFINDGSGFFFLAPVNVMPDFLVTWLCPLDANGDGFPDLLCTVVDLAASRTIYKLWMNQGGQNFVQDTSGRLPEAVIVDYGHFRAFAMDLNADNHPDLILSNVHEIDMYGNIFRSGQDLALINDGTGFFSLPAVNPLPVEDLLTTYYRVIDHDLDQDIDLIRANIALDYNDEPNLELLQNNGGLFAAVSGAFPFSDHIHNNVLVYDFDLDGDEDVFAPRVAWGSDALDWYLQNNGDGTFTLSSTTLPNIVDFTVDCALIDCNADNRRDIFTGNADGEIGEPGRNRLYLNTGGSGTNDPVPGALVARAFPNPFNHSTTISFSKSDPATIPVDIYNMRGQLIKKLLPQASGVNSLTVVWDGCDERGIRQASGVYLYQAKAGAELCSGKLLLLR